MKDTVLVCNDGGFPRKVGWAVERLRATPISTAGGGWAGGADRNIRRREGDTHRLRIRFILK